MLRWLAAIVALLAGLASPAMAAEEILFFDSRVQVQRDATLQVTETIRVRAQGINIRRGIYRDFPLRFRRADGGIGRVGFEVVQVLRNGRPENWFVDHPNPGVARIYIGRREVFIPRGEHTYTIVYRTTRQLRFFPQYDELYWNVTGNFWAFPIRQARVQVWLPGKARILRHALYTGRQGESGQDARVLAVREGHFSAETTRVLRPGEGFTIAIAFPKGVVREPGLMQRWLDSMWDMAGLWWLIGGSIMLLGYFLMAWLRHGRDPAPGVVVPRWEPPAGVSPAIASRLAHEAGEMPDPGQRPFIAALVSLAAKRYIDLSRDAGSTLTVTRRKPGDASLPAGERVIMQALADSPTLRLERASAERVQKLLRDFQAAITREYEDTLLIANERYYLWGLGLLALIAAGLLVLSLLGAPLAWELLSVELLLVVPALVAGSLVMDLIMFRRRGGWLENILPLLIVVPFLWVGIKLLNDQIGAWQLPASGWTLATLAVFAPPVLLVVFRRLLPRPTQAGRQVLDEIAGLRLFMETAERQRLNMPHGAQPPPMSQLLFEKLLPWAIALDVEEPWTQAFRRWLAQTQGERAALAWRPRWYHDSSSRGLLSDAGGNSLSSALADSIAASMPSHSSSGSGGGGSSGGGGGGGGGGGW